MNEQELFRAFVGGFPESLHPLDMRRFAAYALACAENGHYINLDEMLENGISQESVELFETAFTWIREAYGCLKASGRIVP